MYESVIRLEEEKYDWEFKLRKMDFEVSYRINCMPAMMPKCAAVNRIVNAIILKLRLAPGDL